jgi:hypothetical protein
MNKGRILGAIGVLCLVACLVAVMFLPPLMDAIFAALKSSPDALQEDGTPMHLLLLCVGTAAICLAGGAIMVGFAVSECGCRDRWLFIAILIIALLCLAAFPHGTVAGILILIPLWKHRKQFFQAKKEKTPNKTQEGIGDSAEPSE